MYNYATSVFKAIVYFLSHPCYIPDSTMLSGDSEMIDIIVSRSKVTK